VGAHRQKYARLRCFHQSSWTDESDVNQTFSKCRSGYALYNNNIEIATARSRDVAMVTDLRHVSAKIDTPIFILCAAFHNRWKDRNVDYCINTAVDPSRSGKNFVNFGLVTSDILWRVCGVYGCTYAKMRTELVL